MSKQLIESLNKQREDKLNGEAMPTVTPQASSMADGSLGQRLFTQREQAQAEQEANRYKPRQRDDVSFVDKISEAYNMRVGSVADTFESFAAMPTDIKTPVPENAISGTDAITQVLGDAAGLGFDVMGAGISEGFELIDEAFNFGISDAAKSAATALANTSIGANVIGAMQTGGEALEEAKRKYPQEYKTLAATLNIAGSANRIAKPLVGPQPVRRVQVGRLGPGQRTLDKPLAGRDKDVFNIVKDESEEAVLQATERATQSGGILSGSTRTLQASEEAMLDAAKTIKQLNPALPLQTNLNYITDRIKAHGKRIAVLLGRNKDEVNPRVLQRAMDDKVAELSNSNPALYTQNGVDDSAAAFADFERMKSQALRFLSENGTTAEGIHKSRIQFDQFFRKLAKETYGSGTSKPSYAQSNYDAIRSVLNDTVDELVPEAADLRALQSGLFDAAANLAPKAAKEAQGPLGRMFQSFNVHAPTTTLGIGANALPMLALTALSPLYFAGKGFQSIWKAAPIQTEVGRATYTIRHMMDVYKREGFKAGKKAREDTMADLKVLTALVHAMEKEQEEPEE